MCARVYQAIQPQIFLKVQGSTWQWMDMKIINHWTETSQKYHISMFNCLRLSIQWNDVKFTFYAIIFSYGSVQIRDRIWTGFWVIAIFPKPRYFSDRKYNGIIKDVYNTKPSEWNLSITTLSCMFESSSPAVAWGHGKQVLGK